MANSETVQVMKGLVVPLIIGTVVVVAIATAGRMATGTGRLAHYGANAKVQASRLASGRTLSPFPVAF